MRLVLCDDHQLFLDALASALTGHGHDVVATATTPDDAVRAVAQERPDVCLLDLAFPEGSGVEAARRIRERHPATQVLVLSATTDPRVIAEALQAGVNGFVRKDQGVDWVLHALEELANGRPAIDPALPTNMSKHSGSAREDGALRALRRLTEREHEVLKLMIEGAGTMQIADALYISKSTTRTHLQNVLVKLGVHSRLQAAALVARSRAQL